MTIIQKLHAKSVIRKVAKQQGITYRRCYSDMAEAIECAWGTSDPQTKRKQIELIGDSHKPTPEELMLLISTELFSENT